MSERVKVAVAGACGRMGKEIIKAIFEDPEVELASAFERKDHPQIGTDAGQVAGVGELGVKIIDDASSAIAQAEILIDFTYPAPTIEHLEICAEKGKGAVVGTTGLSEVQKERLKSLAEKIPILYSPNMSVGVNLLFALVRKACEVLGRDYDLEVIEAHHRLKKDAPSGTALRLAEILAEVRGWELNEVACYKREGAIGERPKEQIGIQTIRAGDIVGEHTVLFATTGERIELTHKASSRQTFARGALRAVKWLKGKPKGLYSMQECLGIR